MAVGLADPDAGGLVNWLQWVAGYVAVAAMMFGLCMALDREDMKKEPVVGFFVWAFWCAFWPFAILVLMGAMVGFAIRERVK